MKERAPHCHLCSSSKLAPKPFGYRFNGRWLEGMACRDCGIIFIHPQPAAEEIEQMYTKEYFAGDFRCGHAGSYFDEATLNRLANEGLLRRIKRYQPGGKFLEVGCAGGAFLNAARRAGYEVQGVELSAEAAAFARRKFGLDVIVGEVGRAKFSDGRFDVVFMGDVFEHLPNPLATLQELNRIMAHRGLLVLECPTQTNTLFSRLGFLVYGALGKKAAVNLPPYHLFEYRPQSLKIFLRRCGFEIVAQIATAMSPQEIALRGSALQKIGKKIFQYPNFVMTKLLGIFGDRLELFATKRTAAAG
jgi:SAM-dependent methyltransferase